MPACSPSRRSLGSRAAFTLMEVLLVLVILVILGTFTVGMFVNTQRTAKVNQAKAQIGQFEEPLNEFHLELDNFPTTAQGLSALRTAPGDLADPTKWRAFVSKDIPLDPWGHPYQYAAPGVHNTDTFDIWSWGPDGQNGTADDITNWTK